MGKQLAREGLSSYDLHNVSSSAWSMRMRQEVAQMRSALSQKAQTALLAKEQVGRLTTSLSHLRQLRASLAHIDGAGEPLQEELAAVRYSLI